MPELSLTDRINAAPSKEAVIAIIKESGLPTRFKQGFLKAWADDHWETLTAVDYAAVIA
jgi:hypothetical protein